MLGHEQCDSVCHQLTQAICDYQLIVDEDGRAAALYAALPGERHTSIPLADLPITDVERFIAGAIKKDTSEFHHDEPNRRFRVTRTRTTKGWAFALATTAAPPTPLEKTLQQSVVDEIRRAVDSGGLILIVGEHNSGKTHLAGSIFIDTIKRKAGIGYAYQDPPEFFIEGPIGNGHAVQVPIDSAEYVLAAKQARRTRASVWWFGEARDPAASAAVIQAGLAGPPTLATSAGGSLINGVTALLAQASAADSRATDNLANSLSAVIHVKLRTVGTLITMTPEILILPLGHAAPERSIIRTGKIEQLGTYMKPTSRRGGM